MKQTKLPPEKPIATVPASPENDTKTGYTDYSWGLKQDPSGQLWLK